MNSLTQLKNKDAEAINKMNMEIYSLKAELESETVEQKVKNSTELATVVPSNVKVDITTSTLPDSGCIIFKVQSPLIIK